MVKGASSGGMGRFGMGSEICVGWWSEGSKCVGLRILHEAYTVRFVCVV